MVIGRKGGPRTRQCTVDTQKPTPFNFNDLLFRFLHSPLRCSNPDRQKSHRKILLTQHFEYRRSAEFFLRNFSAYKSVHDKASRERNLLS